MLYDKIEAVSVREEAEQFFKNREVHNAELLRFEGVDGFDVYNPSIPFKLNGVEYLAARVEKRESEHSHVRLFQEVDGVFKAVESTVLQLQDPFVAIIEDRVILGGVNVKWTDEGAEWSTDFYEIKALDDFKLIASGPKQMKDIRLLQLPNKKIAVVTRPQGKAMKERFGEIARIGFTIIDRLEQLTAEVIENAPLLEGQFLPVEWGGANQLYNLSNGLIGIVGHKSCRTIDKDGNKGLHYYGMTFAINPTDKKITKTKVFLSRDCFPQAPAKRPDITDVVFVSGIIRQSDGTATVYSGLSDAATGRATIPDPLKEYEKIKI